MGRQRTVDRLSIIRAPERVLRYSLWPARPGFFSPMPCRGGYSCCEWLEKNNRSLRRSGTTTNQHRRRAWAGSAGYRRHPTRQKKRVLASLRADQLKPLECELKDWRAEPSALGMIRIPHGAHCPGSFSVETCRLKSAKFCNLFIDWGDSGSGGWCEIEWFISPHALLNARCPGKILAPDPRAVLEAARTEADSADVDDF